jgi:hypothetical protein
MPTKKRLNTLVAPKLKTSLMFSRQQNEKRHGKRNSEPENSGTRLTVA